MRLRLTHTEAGLRYEGTIILTPVSNLVSINTSLDTMWTRIRKEPEPDPGLGPEPGPGADAHGIRVTLQSNQDSFEANEQTS